MVSKEERSCCIREKDRLVNELKKCDYTASDEARRSCRRQVAKEAGQRGKSCLTG